MVDVVVRLLMRLSGGAGEHMMLLSLIILCAVTGLFIFNTATAVLMAPIALGAAHQIGVSPYPFAMIVAVAASAAFMTPVSSPVLGPGGYKFSDFVRIGEPFTLLVVPLLHPF